MVIDNPAIAVAPTKEFFVLPTQYMTGAAPGGVGYWSGLRFDAAAEVIYFTFHTPHDFTSVTSMLLVAIANATATHRLNIVVRAAANGEDENSNPGSMSDVDTAMTRDFLYEIDITDAFAAEVSAGDYVTVRVTGDATNTANLLVLGLKFRYS